MSNANRWIAKLANLMHLGSPAVADSRRYPRKRADFPVWLSFRDGGFEARCLDVNRTGLAVHAEGAMSAGDLIFVRIPPAGLAGFAHVRYCRPVEGGHILGLQFRGELTRERPIDAGWSQARLTPRMAWDEAEA